jgi:hypothetical protein
MLDALLAGKRLVHNSGTLEIFYDVEHIEGPFVVEFSDGSSSRLEAYWNFYEEFIIKQESKKRYMTRDEVLNFLAEHPNCLTCLEDRDWNIAHAFSFSSDISHYSYCLVENGVRSEPKKFEVEE